jgi:hypothetical protein
MNDAIKQYEKHGHVKTPVLKAIRAYCIGCSGGSRSEVAKCPIVLCELYPFRMGSNPWRRSRDNTTINREKMTARLQEARSNMMNK